MNWPSPEPPNSIVPIGSGHEAAYRDSDHAHMMRGPRFDGVIRVPGASTIAKVEYSDPGGLMGWAAKLAREGKDHNEAKEFAAQSGSLVHKQLEALAANQKFDDRELDERAKGCCQAVAKWWVQHRPTIIESELHIGSVNHRYAGLLDQIVQFEDGRLGMVDLKTCDENTDFDKYHRTGRVLRTFTQMAGYDLAQHEMTGRVLTGGRYLLLASASGDYWFMPDLVPSESEDCFLSKLQTYRADQAQRKAYTAARKQTRALEQAA